MKRHALILFTLVGGLLAGCNKPDTAVFVTNSSLGINFDTKPPTANIAYDRTEGYIAPRYSNGGAPPVAAQMETGGNIFNPIVRQSYITGAAAVIATTGVTPNPAPPADMQGEPDKAKLMFVGTATTVGLKVGFAETGAVPDSLLFGYRRKEISVIPLAETLENGKVKAVYPSVLATIDMNTKSTDPTNTGITSKQFFATGAAADGLAKNNPAISAAFKIKAEEAALAGLTPEQRAAVLAKAQATYDVNVDRTNKILTSVTTDGKLDSAALGNLVDRARQKNPDINPDLKRASSLDELKKWISGSQPTVDGLFDAIS